MTLANLPEAKGKFNRQFPETSCYHFVIPMIAEENFENLTVGKFTV